MLHPCIVAFLTALCLNSAVSTAQPAAAPGAPAPAASFKVATELDEAIWHIFQDSKGTYWFGSHGEGLYRWAGPGSPIHHFTTESGLPGNQVTKIQEDRSGNLYINTSGGISKFDGRTFTTLTLNESDPPVTEVKLGPDVLWFTFGGDEPHALFYDGTSMRKLLVPKTADGDAFEARLPRSKYPNRRYSPYDGYTIYTDSRGNVWFGTASLGACRFDGKNFAWISETELGFNEKDNRTFGTRSIIEDKDGKFWITVTRSRFDAYPADTATAMTGAGGLSYVKTPGLRHPEDGKDDHYTYIMSMVNDKVGDLWLASYGAGVWRYDGTTTTYYPVVVEGEPITVFSIYRDRNDDLWLGTHEHGVCKFNGKAFEKVRF